MYSAADSVRVLLGLGVSEEADVSTPSSAPAGGLEWAEASLSSADATAVAASSLLSEEAAAAGDFFASVA